MHGLGKRTENDSQLGEFFLEGRRHRDAVENRIDGDAREHLLLGEGNAQLLVGAQNFRIEFVEALQIRLLLRRGVIRNLLIIDGRIVNVGPLRFGLRFFERFPMADRPSVSIRA